MTSRRRLIANICAIGNDDEFIEASNSWHCKNTIRSRSNKIIQKRVRNCGAAALFSQKISKAEKIKLFQMSFSDKEKRDALTRLDSIKNFKILSAVADQALRADTYPRVLVAVFCNLWNRRNDKIHNWLFRKLKIDAHLAKALLIQLPEKSFERKFVENACINTACCDNSIDMDTRTNFAKILNNFNIPCLAEAAQALDCLALNFPEVAAGKLDGEEPQITLAKELAQHIIKYADDHSKEDEK